MSELGRMGKARYLCSANRDITIHHSEEPVTLFPLFPLPNVSTVKLHTSYRGQVSSWVFFQSYFCCRIWHILKSLACSLAQPDLDTQP